MFDQIDMRRSSSLIHISFPLPGLLRLLTVACVAGGIRERASGGGAAIITKALAREIPPATQAILTVEGKALS